MKIVNVPVANAYDVLISYDILAEIGQRVTDLLPQAKKIAIITDETVKALYLKQVKASLVAVDLEVVDHAVIPGEASKSSENYIKLQSWLAKNDLTPTDAIIALGGGVIGDLAGFVASTYLRGIPFIQVPTTLLAMVDSSVGGKTAIDLPAGKNLVGTFYQPKLVLCDISVLETLTKDTLHDGYSEIIKYGMLGNAALLADLDSPHEDLIEIVTTCVKMKRDIVLVDEFDQEERKLLNFGHTIGHAIEQLSGYEISHGKAVAIGMAMDTKAAVALDSCPEQTLDILQKLLKKYNLPTTTPYPAVDILKTSMRDKKRAGDAITNIIPTGTGKCVLKTISMDDYHQWIKKGVNL